MSADNWAICPQCLRIAEDLHAREAAALRVTTERDYGFIDSADWLRLKARLDATEAAADLIPEKVGNHFREDYDISGVTEGIICVTYKGECQDCGLTVEFEHEHPVPDFALKTAEVQ